MPHYHGIHRQSGSEAVVHPCVRLLSLLLSVSSHIILISPELRAQSSTNFVRVTNGSGSVLIGRRGDRLITSGLWMTSYLNFEHNG